MDAFDNCKGMKQMYSAWSKHWKPKIVSNYFDMLIGMVVKAFKNKIKSNVTRKLNWLNKSHLNIFHSNLTEKINHAGSWLG